MIRTIEVKVYSPDGSDVLDHKRATAPAGHHFSNTGEVQKEMSKLLDYRYPGNCWRVLEIPAGAKKRMLKYVWDWTAANALRAAMAVEVKHNPGRPSRRVLDGCRKLGELHRAEACQ